MTAIGVAFDGMAPVSAAVAIGRRAERSGIASMWLAEHLGYQESTLTALAVVSATRTLRAVPTGVSPYLRHPMLMAMAMASLSEGRPNRAAIALGVGNPLFLAESGVEAHRPVATMREYVACLRLLFSGAPAHHAGQHFTLSGARLALQEPVTTPIYVAAMGPHMLRLAGRDADGVVLSSGLSVSSIHEALRAVDEEARANERPVDAVYRAAYVITAVSRDGRVAFEACRRKLAFVLRNAHLAESVHAAGISIDQEAIVAAIAGRDLDAATRLVPDEAVEALAIAGSPRTCAERLDEYAGAGLDEVVLSLAGPSEHHREAFALAAARVGGGEA
ncbi:MAG TPA: LLM class flavin-dependent oxidoreductase [Candidatus Limnocylindria bacterium]|nr:LLM class flavin-dependent oxidoreductase [Candidatus Limnocylindria bacterium]